MSRLMDHKGKDGEYPFQYTDSRSTNIEVTWERERQRLKEERRRELENIKAPRPVSVIPRKESA